MKREHFDPKTGQWSPLPEAGAVNISGGSEAPTGETSSEEVSALRAKAAKLMKELSDPKVPVNKAHEMWVEYRAIQERLGVDVDKSDKDRIPGHYL